MKTYQFKKLEITPDEHWIKRVIRNKRVQKSLLFAFTGAVLGYLLYFLMEGVNNNLRWCDSAKQNMIMGAAMGLFITNSPCARGKC